jgi:PAS domain S-box-containing protein
MSTVKILVVEDEAIVAHDLKNSVESLGYEVPAIVASGEEAVQKALELSPDLVLMDIMLNGEMDGIEAAGRIRQKIDLPVIYLTAYADEDTLGRAKATTPFGYIIKPFDERGLQVGIEVALYKHKMDMELKRSKEWLATVLQSIGDAVIATDHDGRVTFMNPVAEDLTGWRREEAAGQDLSKVFNIINEETRAIVKNPVAKVLKTGLIVGLANHTILISRNAVERYINDSAAPVKDEKGNISGVVLVFRDVTAKKQIEQELLQARKLESLGILAGGIAHDFNNILTGILGNITLTKMYIEKDSKVHATIEAAEKASMRAKDLTQQLLTFAKGGEPIKSTVSIKKIIDASASFALRGSNVKYEHSAPDNLPSIQADASQISQVISNLIINADQAMPCGGTIKITTEAVKADNDAVPSIKLGQYIKITLSDTGHGIPDKYLAKIFDPYFTTKDSGNGLGLATVFSIVKKHEGYIFVESDPPKGTTFVVYLPASAKPLPPEKKGQDIITGHGRILLMDDDAMIREVSGAMLEYLGYESEFAANGDEAVIKYKAAMELGKPFDIVILDLTIQGGMGGREAVKKLQAVDPQVKAIVSSGYSMDDSMSKFKESGFVGILTKPYRVETLSETINRVMKL